MTIVTVIRVNTTMITKQLSFPAFSDSNFSWFCSFAFHPNFKNIPCYVMSEVSLKRSYFALFGDGLNFKNF